MIVKKPADPNVYEADTPGLTWNPSAGAYRVDATGRHVDHPPRVRRRRYVAVEAFRVEQTTVPAGAAVGIGNIHTNDPVDLLTFCEFKPNKGFEVIGKGHLSARLTTGLLRAEPVN